MTAVSPAKRKWIQILHVAKRECGLDDAAYRAALAGSCGVESAKDIETWGQYNAALAAFRRLGFRVRVKEPDAGGRNPEWITSRQEYYIRGLWKLASVKKSEQSLRALLMRIAKVSDLRFCKKADAQKVILALRDIAEKAGYDPDGV
ncbi:MAG: regulatory protein GemA [Treponematales bacterium]